MWTTTTVEETEKVYSIVKERNPGKRINVIYNCSSKKYNIELTNETYTNEPTVPLNLCMKVVYGDSVPGDTPILLQNKWTKEITLKYISDITSSFV